MASIPPMSLEKLRDVIIFWAHRADVVDFVMMGDWKTWYKGLASGPHDSQWNVNCQSMLDQVRRVKELFTGFPVLIRRMWAKWDSFREFLIMQMIRGISPQPDEM